MTSWDFQNGAGIVVATAERTAKNEYGFHNLILGMVLENIYLLYIISLVKLDHRNIAMALGTICGKKLFAYC